MSLSPTAEVSAIVAIIQLFFANNPEAQEIEAFLLATLPAYAAIQAGTPATIPAFRIGKEMVGPIPLAPYVAPA